MGQTLTHGIYLPDEGERNCYNGLAANWQLLDGAVGTIAEHTTALAGKAPAVHTHVTADVTDLLSGNHTWSGRNTFSDHTYIYGQWKGLYFQNPEVTAGVSPSGDKRNYIAFLDSNGYTLGNITLNVTGANSTWLQTGVSAKDTNDSSQSVYCGTQYRVYGNGEKYFVPATNGDIYLGTSTLQWKSVYAQSYYYNGVAWGLDKTNTWSVNQYYTGMMILNSSSDVVEQFRQTLPKDVSTSSDALVRFNTLVDSAGHNVVVEAVGHWANYVAKNTTLKYKNDSTKQGTIEFRLNSDGSGLVYPQSSFECDLGNSYNKWKSLNGINPGALSLPSGNSVNIDTKNWNFSWGANYVTAPFDGYISVACFGSALQINNETKAYSMSFAPGSDGFICGLLPVSTGDSIKVLLTRTQTSQYEGYKFIKSRGNVS